MRRAVLAIVFLTACYPATTRPTFVALPQAVSKEVELFIPDATRQLAVALNADGIPVRRTEPRDGWLETGWFDSATLKPTTARPLGEGVVKIRGWVDPSRPNHSTITVEAVYRPMADPSRDARSLEVQLPSNHPVAMRVFRILDSLARKYGGEKADSGK